MAQPVDILFIFPPIPAYIPGDPWGDYLLKLCPPTGLLYLGSYLRQQGYSTAVLDGAAMSSNGISIKQAIKSYSPKIIGISVVTMNARAVAPVVKYVKDVDPASRVVCGGSHATFLYEEMLAVPGIEVVARMEAEDTMLELTKHFLEGEKDMESIAGIAFKNGDEIIVTPVRPFNNNLDSLPFPARDLVNLSHYSMPAVLVSSRGCPYDCIFCAAGPLSGRQRRMRSPENTVAEVHEIVERYNLRSLFFSDDCFTVNKARCEQICRLLMEIPQRIAWACEGRVDTVDPDLLLTMKEAGCVAIQYGAESGSNQILERIKKRISTEQIEQAVVWATERGIRAMCTFQVGHPDDTPDTISETFRFAEKLKMLSPDKKLVTTEFAITTPLPGSALYQNPDKFGVKIRTRDWNNYTCIEPVMDTRNFTAEQISAYTKDLFFQR